MASGDVILEWTARVQSEQSEGTGGSSGSGWQTKQSTQFVSTGSVTTPPPSGAYPTLYGASVPSTEVTINRVTAAQHPETLFDSTKQYKITITEV